jgi:hypothetical protein
MEVGTARGHTLVARYLVDRSVEPRLALPLLDHYIAVANPVSPVEGLGAGPGEEDQANYYCNCHTLT